MTQLFRSKWLNYSLSAPMEKNESFWPKKLSHWRNLNLTLKVESLAELKFDLKSWVTGGFIIRPGKMSNWRIFQSIVLSMLSQFESQCWVNLTLNVESTWLSMLSQLDSQCWVNLTLNVESIWLSMLSQLDSQCWASLTLNVKSIRLSMLSQFDS